MTWTQLHDACQHQDSKKVVELAEQVSEEATMVDDFGSTPLHIACQSNPPLEVIQALLAVCPQAATDKDILGNTPLHVAASNPETDPATVMALLQVCPVAVSITNTEGLTALHMACRHAPANERVIELLIDAAYPYALRTHAKVSLRRNTLRTIILKSH
jgi:ankyrin repeat protein